MKRSWWPSASFALLLPTILGAQQELPAPIAQEIAAPARGEVLHYLVQLPPEHDARRRWPLLLLLPDGAADLAAAATVLKEVGRDVALGGFVVVAPAAAGADRFAALLTRLRRTYRIDQGGMHLAAVGRGIPAAIHAARQHRHEFQSVTVSGGTTAEHVDQLLRLPVGLRGRVHVLDGIEVGWRQHFASVHGVRAQPGPAGDVARTLDEFHDAAAIGDEERYFAILPDDAVFLGTDPSERWSGAAFREFALPYFERDSAWTYVPLSRHVTVEAGGAVAWFDEELGSAAYGDCRGSGVLARRDGAWVLRQYNLTIPVPNDLSREVVARIRAFADGRTPAVTTVVVVRHAEKQGEQGDVDISAAGLGRSERLRQTLAGLDVHAVFTSQYRRTAATVAPLCRAKGLEPQVVAAGDAAALAARIQQDHRGQTVVVAGHSNTVPDLLRALGVATDVTIGDDEYDRLFVVTIALDGVRLLSLRYGGS